MTLRSRFIIFAATFLLPLSAAATPPSPISGVKAWEKDGQIHVGWQKLPDTEKIAYYRIFFSEKSILQNNGSYDDFDIADGTKSEHVLSGVPREGDLFLSVLAVNDVGEESPFFAEEASVTSSESQIPNPGVTLSVLSVQAISSTGVTLTFSLPITLTAEQAPTAFTVEDGSGAVLPITKIVVLENKVTLHTLPQNPAKVYQITVQNVRGKMADGALATLDATESSVLFAAFPDAPLLPTAAPAMPATPAMPSMPAGAASDVRGPLLRAQADDRGHYVVEASWETQGDPALIDHFLVRQTVDHGVTFGAPITLPGTARSIRIPGVPPIEFGVAVQVVAADGQASKGTVSFITLGQTAPALPAQAAPRAPERGLEPPLPQISSTIGLPQSGIGMISAILLAGCGTGMMVMRRRRHAAA